MKDTNQQFPGLQVQWDNKEDLPVSPTTSQPSALQVQWDDSHTINSPSVTNTSQPTLNDSTPSLSVTWDDHVSNNSNGAPDTNVSTNPPQPTIGDYAKEYVGRPLARAARSTAVGVVGGLGDLSQTITSGAASLLPDSASRPIIEATNSKPVSEFIREGFDKATDNFAAPRNAGERIADSAAEFAAGTVFSPGAINTGTKAVGKAVEGGLDLLGKPSVSSVTGDVTSNAYKKLIETFTPKSASEVGAITGLGAGMQTAEEVAKKKGEETSGLDTIGLGLAGTVAGALTGKGISASMGRVTEAMANRLATQAPKEVTDVVKRDLGISKIADTVEQTGMAPEDLSTAVKMTNGDMHFGEGFTERLKNNPEVAAGQENVQRIFTGKTSSYYANYVNKYGKLLDLERERAAYSGIDVGSKDILQSSDIAKVTNRAANSRVQPLSMIGGDNQDFVLRRDEFGTLYPDHETKPLLKIYDDAAKNGSTDDELAEFIAAKDAIDDHVNTQLKKDKIFNQIYEKEFDPNKANYIDEELINLKKQLKELEGSQKARMPYQQADEIVSRYANIPWAQQALKDNNKLNNILLDDLHRSGTISIEDVERIRTAHPNYVPAYKVVDDLTPGTERMGHRGTGSTKGIKLRGGNGQNLKTMDVLEAQIRNIVSSSSAAERSFINNMMFENLMKLPEDELAEVFVESKSDIFKALDTLKSPDNNINKVTSGDILGTVKAQEDGQKAILKSGNVKFYVDGKELSLTLKDPDMVQLFNSVPSTDDAFIGVKMIQNVASFMRRAITQYDPTFLVRSIERESQDFPAYTKKGGFIAPLLRGEAPDYFPVFSQIKALFEKELNPELYQTIEANYGRSSYNRLDQKSTDDIVEYAINRNQKKGIVTSGLDKFERGTENLATRFDLAPRIVNYKMMVKNGATHDEAMRVAFEMGFNPAQSGLDKRLRSVTSIVPFSTAFINSTDRLLRLGINNPGKLATGLVLGAYLPYKTINLQNQLWTNPETGRPWVEDSDPNLDRYVLKIYGPWSKSVNDYIPYSLGWVVGRAGKPIDNTLIYAAEKLEEGFKLFGEEVLNLDIPEAKELKAMGMTGQDVVHGWATYMSDIFTGPTSIPIISPLLQLSQNKDRMGREIVPEQIKQDRPELSYLEYDTNSSPTIVAMAKSMADIGVNVSPKQAQFLLENITFGVGKVALSLADTIYSALNKEGPEKVRDPNFPGSKIIIGNMDPDKVTSGRSSQFKGIKDEVVTAYQAARDLEQKYQNRQVSREEYRDFLNKNKTALKWYPQVDQTRKEIADLYKRVDEIKTSSSRQTPERELLGDPEKQSQVNRILKRVDLLQKRILDRISQDKDSQDLFFKRYSDVGIPEKALYGAAGLGSKATEELNKFIEKSKQKKPE